MNQSESSNIAKSCGLMFVVAIIIIFVIIFLVKLAYWWEHLLSTNMAQDQFPDPWS